MSSKRPPTIPSWEKPSTPFALGHINGGTSTLPSHHRELLILRIGWLCQSEYEWAQHSRIAESLGFTDAQFRDIIEGPGAAGWAPFEATLLRAVNELHETATITGTTWQALEDGYRTQQLIDLVFTVGTYTLASMALNAFGVELDPGLNGFPESI